MRLSVLLILLSGFLLFACENQELIEQNKQLKEHVSELKSMMSRMRESDDKLLFLSAKLNGVKARIITDLGNIELEFFPEKAPLQCFNFITRAESGFYNGTLFHRVVSGFMIQGGDPLTKGSDTSKYGFGGPIVNIPHEFNDIKHKRGILSTARGPNLNAGAGSQFFIMHGDNEGLDHQYTAFGKVTQGMDVVDKIGAQETIGERPVNPVKITSIQVYR